jgi:NAD(P)-dependent dehydrogenase (short-subunit alcohol dehydrogenase family)
MAIFGFAYAAAKGGVNAITVDMAYSDGREGIRVNAVAPGHITTSLLFSVTRHQATGRRCHYARRTGNLNLLLSY